MKGGEDMEDLGVDRRIILKQRDVSEIRWAGVDAVAGSCEHGTIRA
jgi:hypothetical protein